MNGKDWNISSVVWMLIGIIVGLAIGWSQGAAWSGLGMGVVFGIALMLINESRHKRSNE